LGIPLSARHCASSLMFAVRGASTTSARLRMTSKAWSMLDESMTEALASGRLQTGQRR